MEIDLKCAEKVNDSDVESNADEKVKNTFEVQRIILLNANYDPRTERIIPEGAEFLWRRDSQAEAN